MNSGSNGPHATPTASYRYSDFTPPQVEGVFSKEQKAQLIEKITEPMIEVEGEGMRDLTWVVIEEVKQWDWAIGGKAVFPKAKNT